MDEPRTYDAFISYSYRDKDRVHPIVEALKTLGLRVFLDTESIPIGESLSVALERALYRSNTLIAFLSRHSPKGSWVERELEAFQSLEGGRRRIIPVLLDDHSCPLKRSSAFFPGFSRSGNTCQGRVSSSALAGQNEPNSLKWTDMAR